MITSERSDKKNMHLEKNEKKILVVAYSYSGNTYKIAQVISRMTGGDFCDIYPWQPYPMSFPELLEQVRKEIAAKYRPRLLPFLYSPHHYDTIFVGSPNWCGTIAPPLFAWLKGNELSGKDIYPFCSHCGGVPGNMQKDVQSICKKSKVHKCLSIINDGGEEIENIVMQYLLENKMFTGERCISESKNRSIRNGGIL